jgi:hypothetical protein
VIKLGRRVPLLIVMAILLLFATVPAATARDDSRDVRARLDGWQETPSVSTTGHGRFKATVRENSLTYTLSYADLEGATTTQAHIHLGRPAMAGGVSVFLCGGAPPNSNKPACPPKEGTVSGTIVASDVIGPTGQGIAPGEFAELVRAIRAGATYANVHTDKHPGGEIRGHIETDDHDRDRD